MTELRVESLSMPSTTFGGENPLPPLVGMDNASSAGRRISYAFEKNTFLKPHEHSVLPHLLQDQYDRSLNPRDFKTAVLENEYLRVSFLLELGGRMWSMIDKKNNRELLFKNPVFRTANLACRDAWFSGGVEWNVALIAHTPFTCSPLFAARVAAADGTPVLRLYEWDRIRGVPWQIDFYLPEKSRFLFVRPRIINPWDRDIPMYWWSNISVLETLTVRTLAPANTAVRHSYDGNLVGHDLPITEGMDVTYPAKRPNARDLYFNIPPAQRAWVAAIDADGYGLVHSSTDRLRGRKIFTWGSSPGGRRWNEFLSLPGHAYIELQGGLAPTQGEYVRMPAHARFEWLEAYGALQTTPALAHSTNWKEAWGEADMQLEKVLPRAEFEEVFHQTQGLPESVPTELLHTGSGWGALERRRREKLGQPPLASASLPFPDSTLGLAQEPWLILLEEGKFATRSPTDLPLSPITQREWRDLLEESIRGGKGNDWLSWYQVGIMRWGAGEHAAAAKAWETSVERSASAWALRNLAVFARSRKDFAGAADLWGRAWQLQSTLLPLTVEYARALAAAERYEELTRFIATLPPDVQAAGRIRLFKAQAALACNDFATVADFFSQKVEIPNTREREVSLTDLWFSYHEKRLAVAENRSIDEEIKTRVRQTLPPPAHLDFRLSPAAQ